MSGCLKQFGRLGSLSLVACAFLLLSAPQSVSIADDDIKALERKLELLKKKASRKTEYKKMRGMLEVKLKEVQDQIQMLDEEYKDVAKSAPAPVAKKKVAKKKAAAVKRSKPGAKGPDHEWKVRLLPVGSRDCADNGLTVAGIKVDGDGNMSFEGTTSGGWYGTYSGNLRAKKVRLEGARGAKFSKDTKVTADNDGYTIRGTQEWDTGYCNVAVRIE